MDSKAPRYTDLTDGPSHGINLHKIKRLAVANGGIQTRWTGPNSTCPKSGQDMLHREAGTLLDQIELPDFPKNSIHHLALQGDPSKPVSHLGLCAPDGPPFSSLHLRLRPSRR